MQSPDNVYGKAKGEYLYMLKESNTLGISRWKAAVAANAWPLIWMRGNQASTGHTSITTSRITAIASCNAFGFLYREVPVLRCAGDSNLF